MSTEENKAVIQRFHEGMREFFRTGNIAPLLDQLDPNARFSISGMPNVTNLEGLKAIMPVFRTAFPDIRFSSSDLIAEGDFVAYRDTWTGTHQGDLMGIPPTGKQVTVTETHIDRIANGKIIEHTFDWDQMGLMQQLGVIPAPGQGGA